MMDEIHTIHSLDFISTANGATGVISGVCVSSMSRRDAYRSSVSASVSADTTDRWCMRYRVLVQVCSSNCTLNLLW